MELRPEKCWNEIPILIYSNLYSLKKYQNITTIATLSNKVFGLKYVYNSLGYL